MDYSTYWLFKEISSMSKELRASIRKMDKEYRGEIGMEIRSLLRELKFNTYKITKHGEILTTQERDYFKDSLIKLKIMLDECLEDKLLLVKGPYTIISPRKRIMDIMERIDPASVQTVKFLLPLMTA